MTPMGSSASKFDAEAYHSSMSASPMAFWRYALRPISTSPPRIRSLSWLATQNSSYISSTLILVHDRDRDPGFSALAALVLRGAAVLRSADARRAIVLCSGLRSAASHPSEPCRL